MNRSVRNFAALPLLLLLWACPKEQKEAVIRFEGDRLVIDGDRSDCIIRLQVESEGAGPAGQVPWSTESPMPIRNDSTCPMRFPVTYGKAPERVSTYPGTAAPLVPGRRYRVRVDGFNADHGALFTAP